MGQVVVMSIVVGFLVYMFYPDVANMLNNIQSEQQKSRKASKSSENEGPDTSKANAPKEKRDVKLESQVETEGKAKQEHKVKMDMTKSPGDDGIPEEVRNFKATYQREMAPKKIFADGRRLPPVELLPQKPNNSSVK